MDDDPTYRERYEAERRARELAEQALEHLRRVQAVTDTALANLGTGALLEELLLRIRDLLHADTSAILVLDTATNELVARAAIGIEEEVEQGVRIPVGRGFAGRIAATRTPVVLDDVDHADVLNPILREKGIKSMAGVPLVAADRVVGVLHVGSLVPRTFTEDDVALLQIVGDRAALAVAHATAHDRERQARLRLEQVQSVTDAALQHLELHDLLDELLARIRDVLHVDTCAILLLDEDAQELVATAAVGIEEEVEQGVRIPVGVGFAGRVVAERHWILLPDVDRADVFNPILRQKGIKSLLGAPLLVRGEAIGVVHVGSLTPRVFTPEEIELLLLVAERVALAIDRARVHDDMIRLDALKLNFVAVASHELRTPATSVYGMLATLRARGDELAPEVREELEETLWEQAGRLRRLIDQLLDLSRLDAGRIPIEPQRLELRRLLTDFVSGLDEGSREAVTVDVEDGLHADLDPLAVERVVSNLIGNARRYGKPPIVLRAERSDAALRISVTDGGDGVPEELRPRLFDRFERGVYDGGGSGLGLAIAHAYARAHGGDLVYEPLTCGSRFELILPEAA